MAPATPKKPRARGETESVVTGGAYRLGRGLFLVLVWLTPLILLIPPAQLGSLAVYRAWDPVDLPKAVSILVFAGLSLAAWCVSTIRGRAELRWHPAMWILVGLFGWAAVSTAFSPSPAMSVLGSQNSGEGLVAILGYGLVAFLAMQYVRSTRDLRAVMIAAVVSGSLVSAYALLQYLGVDPIAWSGDIGDRVLATFGNPDKLGSYLIFPLVLAVGLALSVPRGWARLGWWGSVTLIAAALVATGTRGAWIGALAAVFCIGLLTWGASWKAPKRTKLLLGALSVAGFLTLVTGIVLTRPRATETGNTLWATLTRLSNGRTVIWLTGLRGWLARPITGWGPDGFERAFGRAVGADWYALIEGLQGARNAHGMPVQVLVTLGIPGLVLTVWAIAYTLRASLRVSRQAKGSARLQLVALWAALVGMLAGGVFGLTEPAISVWLWLAVGVLLAPISRRVPAPPKAVLAVTAALGVVLALWAGSWQVADVVAGRAMQLAPGPAQVSALQSVVRLNPIAANYRWMAAEAMLNEALAEQKAGQAQEGVKAMKLRAISAYYRALDVDRGDPLVRTALANILVGYAVEHPESNAAQRAVQVAEEAVKLSPNNPAALGALARAYRVSGRLGEAVTTARLAQSVAPEYAMQTLGSLLGGATP